MTRVEFSLFRTGSSKGFHKLSRAIELDHVVRAITVGNENRAIGPDGYRAWLKSIGIFVNIRFLRKSDGPFLLPIELELEHLVIGWPGRINKFRAAFVT